MADPRALLDAYAKKETILLAVGDPTCDGRWTPFEEIAPAAFAALRVLLDKHQPFQYGDEEEEFADASRRWCRECTGGDQWRRAPWPCVTVRTITTALEADRG